MIDWHDPDGRPAGVVTPLSALRWTAAGLAVIGLHAGGLWLARNWPQPADGTGGAPAAIMMELSPLAVAPDLPQQNIASGPQMMEAEDQPAPEPEKPTEEKAEPKLEPNPVETKVTPPEQPKAEKAEVVLPPKTEPKASQPRAKRKQKAAPRTTAPPGSQARRADRSVAPADGTAAAMAQASWRGALMAHFNRLKRFPPGAAGTGTATVAFTIDRSGRVLSSRLVRSSGDTALDAEALSLSRRASPVPAPPPSVGGGSITIAVPIKFTR